MMQRNGKVISSRGFLLLGLLWTLPTMLSAQVQDLGAPIIRNYESELYKAHNQNWAVVQDHRGVMYFGNTFGILEFDGRHWQFIPTLGNTVTRGLAAGPDGTIYYGSIGDFGYLAVSAGGKVSAVSLKEIIPESERAFNDVWQVVSSTDGIYFLTRSRIFRFHTGKITALAGKFALGQACVLNGTLFYADMEKGICLLDGDQVVPIPRLAGVYNGGRITLAPFQRHGLLAGRISGDFLRIDLTAFWDETSRRYVPTRQAPKDMVLPFHTELDALVKENQAFLYKLIPLGPDTYAMATLKAGIIIFDRAGKIIRAINKDVGLPDNSVFGLMNDRSNDLWAASNVGISHIALSVPQSEFGARNGIEGVPMAACLYNSRLYVSTYQNLFVQVPYRYTLKDCLPKFAAVRDGPREGWQFLEVEGDLMLASGRGLFRIRDETAFRIPGSAGVTCLCLGVSRKWPGYLFAGLQGGVEVFKRTAGQWALVGRMQGIRENIRRMIEDANGDLWLSTEVNGLLRVHFPGGEPTDVRVHGFGPEQGLPGIRSLRAAILGKTLYALSLKGLFRADIRSWNGQEPDQTHFAPDLTLGKAFSDPPSVLNVMVADGRGGFIFSTSEKVVWAVPGQDGQFHVKTGPFQGLPSSDWTIYVQPNGGVWVPGKALFRVDPWAKKNYAHSFDVLIRKLASKTRRLVFEGTHGRPGSEFREQRTVFTSSQDPQEAPVLPFRENAVSFNFAAAFYEKPGSTQFQYLLEGFDKDWSEWAGDAKKEYTNLPEGKYRFRVRARNVYGTMGHEAEYRLRIMPPWYRTIWAYLGYLLVGVAFFSGGLRLYTWRLIAARKKLQYEVRDRTQEVVRQKDEIQAQAEKLLASNDQLAVINKELEKLSIVASETDNAVMIMDEKGNIEWINPGFTRLYGLTLEELYKKSGHNLMTASLNPDIKEVIGECLREKKSVTYESTFETKWGQKICSQTTLTPILDDKDNLKKLITIDSDISERKIAEEKIITLLAEKEIILKEVHHRIKNNMATVMGLFYLQANTLKNQEAIKALKDAGSRVQSMVVLYEKLYQSIGSDDIAVRSYLPSLVDEIVANFPGSAKVKVEKKIADFVLPAGKLQPLGIIINELLTNIMKYAFAGRSTGLITVTAELNGDRVSLAIQDNGIGMPETVDFENSSGFGLTLVRILTRQIAGTIKIQHGNGTRVILEFLK